MDEIKREKLYSLLIKFRPQELSEIVDYICGNVTWEDIKTAGISLKINLLNSRNIASLWLEAYQNSNPTSQDIQNVIWYLQFFGVYYHNKVIWNCITLFNEIDSFPSDLDDLHRKIIRAYRSEARNTEVLMKIHDEIVWLMLIEKIITKRGLKHGKPLFAVFSVSLKKHYLFYSPKVDNDSTECDYLSLLGKALGFQSYKHINFYGRDVRTMFQMVKRHENQSNALVLYQPDQVHMQGNILDFTQGREKMKYARNLFPPGCTKLSEFTAHSTNAWRGKTSLSDNSMVTTQLKIKVKGNNYFIEDVLRALIAQNLISVPVPEYISKLPSLDRNSIKLKPVESQEQPDSEFSD